MTEYMNFDDMSPDNIKTMARYFEVDRNGWRDMFCEAESTVLKLYVAVGLMAVPAVYGIIHGIAWLVHHIHFG